MKTIYFSMVISLSLFYMTSLGVSQTKNVVKSIKLDTNTTLLLERTSEPLAKAEEAISPLPPGVTPFNFQMVKEVYTVSIKTGDSIVEIDRAEFKSAPSTFDGAGPRFSIYDAVIDSNKLRYIFAKKGDVLVGTATVSPSGSISEFRQKKLPDSISRIEGAQFLKDKDGKVTLEISQAGKMDRTFQFDDHGDTLRVAPE
jgi:hypothetical protein